MSQVEQVRRRLVESLHAREIERTARYMNWTEEAFVDLILLCSGDPRRVNQHWRAMLAATDSVGAALRGDRGYRMLFDWIAAHEAGRQP